MKTLNLFLIICVAGLNFAFISPVINDNTNTPLFEEEEYIDDIPFDTWELLDDSIKEKILSEEYTIIDFTCIDKNNTDNIPCNTKNYIKKNIKYPGKAFDSEIEGVVYVSFYYDESGDINIDQVNASHPVFNKQVISHLGNYKLSEGCIIPGKLYSAKFSFLIE